MKKLYTVLAVVLLASMILAACGSPATPAPTEVPATTAPETAAPATVAPTETPKFKVGEVTDLGGVDDKSFNASGWAGMQKAMADLGVDGKYLESKQQSDYAKNIQQFVDEKTNLIVTVGFLLGVDTATAAKANPETKFAIVDYSYPDCFGTSVEGKDCGSATEIPNVLGLTFQTDQAAFLAGYAAAASTKTGKVGTFGGINIPPVTIFMKGFQAGVEYYNTQKKASVKVLGWDSKKNDGLFTGNFDSTDDGRKFAESLMQEGADIIMPVAGPVGLGSAAVCKETGKCKIVGVDTDWTVSAAEYKDVILTSVMKNINVAVYNAIKSAKDGSFKGGVYLSTLANGGVGLAAVNGASAELTAELDQVKADIISGKITIAP
ncbi:MAG: BMP family ABC transporter substrate-binding protein [Chloroflexi bacterium]|nr:BMP family ABC transporter substrate-binding protein [Chloroflexota bacterium]